MKTLKKIGTNIREKRIECGFTKEELAFEADVHRTYIGAVERGEKNISIISLSKIAKALRTNVSDLTKGL